MSDALARLNRALEGRYAVEREIGEGGMATVFLAKDLRHNRSVALKVLKPELAAVVGAERFLAEIETTANLQHPHILPLFDSGEADSFLYYVMPFVEGESLRDRLDRDHQLPVDDALRITSDVAEALEYAHQHGVIHRDIKPANILIQAGRPLIADFGIALAVSAGGGGRLTETGLSMGTPYYMSPEQATGDHHVGPATDIYALGCVLFEMLVGEPPFTGSSAQAVLGKILTGDMPAASAARTSVPTHVDAAIRKALEKLPADRFASANELVAALRNTEFRYGLAEKSFAAPSRSMTVLAAVLGVAVGAVGSSLFLESRTPQLEFGAVRKVTFDPGIELLPAISPDGQEVAYVSSASAADTSRVVVVSLGGGRPSELSDEGRIDETYPRWTPDGASISFQADGQAFQVPARGGTPRPLARAQGGAEVTFSAWSPDGERFAYVRVGDASREIVVATLEGEETTITEVSGAANALRWSPDGQWIAYAEGNPNWVTLGRLFGNVAPSSIKVVAAAGGDPVTVAPAEYLNVSPEFLPDGRLLFVSGRGGVRDLYMAELGSDGTPKGEPTRVTAGLDPHSVSVSMDGHRLVYGTLARRQNVYAMPIPSAGPVSGYQAVAVTAGQQVIEGITISPDGEWIAYDSNRSGSQDVYRRRLRGGESLQLSRLPSEEFVRSWSPDGTLLAGHGFNEGVRDIWVMDSDGLSFDFIAPHPDSDRYPAFSPDGTQLAFGRVEGAVQMLYVVDRGEDGGWGEPRRLAAGAYPRWSPDGRMLVANTDSTVLVVPVDGGGATVVFAEASGAERGSVEMVEWYERGTRILVMRRLPDSTWSIWSISVDGGQPRELIRFADPGRPPRPEMAVHDDILYFTLGEFEADIWVMELEWN